MKKFLRILSILLAFLHLSILSHAQDDYQIKIVNSQFSAKQVIGPSPDAAALGKYGNVPVSLFTGSPTINFPLTELKGNMLQLPVSLSYNSTGFKADEVASWVGLGWTLNAGGVITRSVSGNPDVSSNYYKSPSPIKDPNSLDEYHRQLYFRDIAEGAEEVQPDMYFYNFNGRSGKFYITPAGEIFKKEKDMLQIIPSLAADEFTIRDESGNVYRFTHTEVTTTQPTDEYGVNRNYYTFTSSWYLTSITSADAVESIQFDYYAPTATQQLHPGALLQQSATWSYNTSSCNTTPASVEKSSVFSEAPPAQVTRKFLKSAKLVRSGIDVAYIDFGSLVDQRQDLWNADFTGERMLETIKLYVYHNGTAVLSKSWKLFYSYFPTTQQLNGGLKLRLDKIQEMAIKAGTSDNSPYQYEYNTGNLPKKHPFGIDHWGYYNGANNTSLLPNVQSIIEGTLKTYGEGADREPNFNNTSLALITKVIYPTGGSSIFEFESHGTVGGVRIKKITDYSFTGTVANIKKYTYGDQYAGPKPKYDMRSNYSTFTNGCVGSLCQCPALGRKAVTITSTSIYGLGFSRGTPIGYGVVTETQTNANGDPLGKTIYYYDKGSPEEADDDIRSGQLLGQEIYDNNNKLLKQITNTYTYNQSSSFDAIHTVPEANQDNKKRMCLQGTDTRYYTLAETSTCDSATILETRFTFFDFSLRQQWNQINEQIVKQYDQLTNSYVITRKKYTYGTAHNSPIQIEEQTSNNGELLMTSIKYIGDYDYSSVTSDPTANALKSAYFNNIKTLEVEKYQYRMNADGTNKRYIKGIVTTYQSNGLPAKIYGLELSSPLTSFTTSSIVSGLLSFNSNYKIQGTMTYSGHTLIEQAKTNDMPSSYVWDYISGRPVASVVNANSSNIAYTSFETAATGGWTIPTTSFNTTYSFSGIRSFNMSASTPISKSLTATAKKQVVSYWTRGGALTVTANGVAVAASAASLVSQQWSYFEHIAPIGTTSIQVTGTGIVDELRTYPINSQMTTYGFTHETGVTSQIDQNNKITYYEYDGLNRLINIRDEQSNIIKNIKYNYGLGSAITAPKKIFYNIPYQNSYAKNCSSLPGSYGTVETYVVPGGKYAALSQTAADNLASADLAANGQAYAEANGSCYYKSGFVKAPFYKTTCSAYDGPAVAYFFSAFAGMFTSTVDQTTANNLAIQYVQDNGQQAAEENGTCKCAGEGLRWFGGPDCQTGTRINYSYRYLPATDNYECKYYYVFSDGSVSQFYYQIVTAPCFAS
jgi:hypothetical protein